MLANNPGMIKLTCVYDMTTLHGLIALHARRFFEPVYPGSDGNKMVYEEHRCHARGALTAAGCFTKKTTHLPRSAGADRVINAG